MHIDTNPRSNEKPRKSHSAVERDSRVNVLYRQDY